MPELVILRAAVHINHVHVCSASLRPGAIIDRQLKV
jgi:hypothetical protein